MIQKNDYRGFLSENDELLKNLRASNSVLYPTLKDSIEALDFIVKYIEDYPNDEELGYLEEFFEFVYGYFTDTLNTINIMYDHYFNKDYFDFKHYEELVNYYLLVTDVMDSLEEIEYMNAHRKSILTNLQKEIDQAIMDKKDFKQEDLDNYDALISQCIPTGVKKFETARDFISRIREEIMIDCE